MKTSRQLLLAQVLGYILCLLIATPALADGAVRIKLATLAPKGSIYHRVLQEMGEKFRAAEGPDATFTIYTDGSQGSEADVVRRMRIGQLNGAMMSVVGLSEIDMSASVFQKMPLVFRSWDEVEYVGHAMRPDIEHRFHDKGFVIVLWGEAGWVRFFSKQPATQPDEFRARRLFAWAGDSEQVEMMKAMGYRPVVLETADIIPGLQTGMIDTVPVTPVWALATQLDQLAPNMIDIKWAPIVGALVLTRKAWESMTPAARDALQEAAIPAAGQLRAYQSHADTEAIVAMEKRGLRVQRLTPETLTAWEHMAQKAYPMIRGQTVPAQMFDEALRLVDEFRRLPRRP